MIAPGTARELTAQIRNVEERIERLLISGWRQASAEAADLQPAADALRESGLVALAMRVEAVALAADAPAALQAMAVAASACHLLRVRLEPGEAADGWREIAPSARRTTVTNDTLVPITRFVLEGRDAWVCAWPARSRVVVLEAPQLALPQQPEPHASSGFLERLKQRARDAAGLTPSTGFVWLHRRLRGSLSWEGRLPIGTTGDLPLCGLDNARWVDEDEHDEGDQYRNLIAGLTKAQDTYSGMVGWSGVILTVGELDRARTAEYDWIDPSTQAAFETLGRPRAWALFALAHPHTMPLAVLEPGQTPRIVHLAPGLPSEALTTGA